MRIILSSIVTAVAAIASACSTPGDGMDPERSAERPERFTIAPDDYHVPYAGTAEDGRKFFLSDELFDMNAAPDEAAGFVGLYLWNADGSFAEVRVDRVGKADDAPPGQASSAGADDILAQRLAQLGSYTIEPITVEPFTTVIDGVTFGWDVGRYDDGTYFIGILPGDFIVYHEPWDGLEYDT